MPASATTVGDTDKSSFLVPFNHSLEELYKQMRKLCVDYQKYYEKNKAEWPNVYYDYFNDLTNLHIALWNNTDRYKAGEISEDDFIGLRLKFIKDSRELKAKLEYVEINMEVKHVSELLHNYCGAFFALDLLIQALSEEKNNYCSHSINIEQLKHNCGLILNKEEFKVFKEPRGDYSFVHLMDSIANTIDALIQFVSGNKSFRGAYGLFHVKTATEAKVADVSKALDALPEKKQG